MILMSALNNALQIVQVIDPIINGIVCDNNIVFGNIEQETTIKGIVLENNIISGIVLDADTIKGIKQELIINGVITCQ